jgi:hypothetical protein
MKLTFAQKRLLLGSTNVGIIIVLCLIALLSGVPRLLFSNHAIATVADVGALALFLFTFAVLQSGFDLIGATACEREDIYIDLKDVFRKQLRAITIQSLVLGSCALLIGIVAKVSAQYGVFLLLCALCYFSSKYKVKIASLLCPEISFKEIDSTKIIVSSNQPCFHGGIHNNQDLFSNTLLLNLSEDEALILHRRRMLTIQSGAAQRGQYCAYVILLMGAFFGLFVFKIDTKSIAGIVEFSLWNTLWSFICLLIIPTFDRLAVFAADHRILLAGVERSLFKSALEKQDIFFDDEKQRVRLIENIFHPIPMLQDRISRIERFESDSAGKSSSSAGDFCAPWHTLRHSLYLSWSFLNLISRSVHCSVGRPQCWVFLPVE